MYADEAWDMQKQKAQSPSPPGSFSIKLNFTKLIQGLTAVLKLDTPSTKTPGGANNIAGSVNVLSVAATMGSPAPGGLAAWLTAKPSFIPSLQFLVNRSSAGLLVPLLDLLYPFCRPAQQRGFVQQAAPDGTFKKGKKQLVNHLAELLEYPSISNDEVSWVCLSRDQDFHCHIVPRLCCEWAWNGPRMRVSSLCHMGYLMMRSMQHAGSMPAASLSSGMHCTCN
jgi:hypothetical protein